MYILSPVQAAHDVVVRLRCEKTVPCQSDSKRMRVARNNMATGAADPGSPTGQIGVGRRQPNRIGEAFRRGGGAGAEHRGSDSHRSAG